MQQHASSLGGPRVLLPSEEVELWIKQLGDNPTPDEGLYGLACSINDYCGIIRPWNTSLLVFGDDPSDIYWSPENDGGLLIRWVAASTLEELTAFAKSVAARGDWMEYIEWHAQSTNYTLMDTCSYVDDNAARIDLVLSPGKYVIESQFAEAGDVATIVQRLRTAR